MRFVRRDEDGGWRLGGYAAYLDAHRDRLAEVVMGHELLSAGRNGLESRGSFHDAWLEGLKEREGVVELRLLGPYHDRRFVLTYSGAAWSGTLPAPKRDLLVHELRLEDGRVVHEFVFDGAEFTVVADGLVFREVFL